jgi:hypothetical protein
MKQAVSSNEKRLKRAAERASQEYTTLPLRNFTTAPCEDKSHNTEIETKYESTTRATLKRAMAHQIIHRKSVSGFEIISGSECGIISSHSRRKMHR